MKSIIKKILAPVAAGAIAISSTSAMAASDLEKKTFCVFDIIGSQGPIFDIMKDYKLAALNWGVELDMKAYTDEKIAAEDFKAGKCNVVALSGLRGRAFNSFTGTLDSIGSIPTDKHMQVVLKKLASPKLGKYMINGEYEVAGIAPGGAAFLFTKDRSIDTVGELSGKKIAVLEFDKSQSVMVESIGASPVSVSIANVGPMFNNGSVDIIAAPAIAYEALELYKGLGENGAIVNFSLAQLTLQVIIRHADLPEGYGQKSREYIWGQYDRAQDLIDVNTKAIKPGYWLDLPEADKVGYQEMFRQSRIKLREMGIYDGKMLKFLSKVRCAMDASLAECTAKDKE
ncbi:MAG: DUF6091 family protein [Pseudomonadales bacterium]|nr:DUF6091 family protein [Pseudomonadales bacterium]